ncbi:MAG: hypothetical protein ACRDRB_11115 [Pseudonocardiaceae bacterium]
MADTIGVMANDFQGWLFANLLTGTSSPQLHLGSDTDAISSSTSLSDLRSGELPAGSYQPIRITPSQVTFIPGVPAGFYEISASSFALGPDVAGQVVGCWWMDGGDPMTTDHVLWAGSVTPPLAIPPAGATVVIGPLDLPVLNCAIPSPPSNLLLLDFFEDADGTELTAHTPLIGGNWVAITGNFHCLSRRAIGDSSAGGDATCVIDLGASDVFIRGDTVPGGDWTILYLRWQDVNNNWTLQLSYLSSWIRLIEVVGGVGTVRATASFTRTANIAYRLEATCDDDTITCLVATGNNVGSQTATVTYSPATTGLGSTTCGIGAHILATSEWLSIMATSLTD